MSNNKYNHKEIEQKWAQKWEEEKMYKTPEGDFDKEEKMYILDMFPYPSGYAMHVGHVEGYVGTDIVSRFSRMKGKNVLHPMGWDAFGLPAENFAIKTGTHPRINTDKAIETFKDQLSILGLSYDWEREIGSHNPDYYKWTQWFFLLLYKKGLAYKKEAPVNWCESCKTVLANEQVVNGRCERCDTEVVQKNMSQWFFKITDYADRLIKDLDTVNWPESTKINQINWIGKKEGINITYAVKDSDTEIVCFTTTPVNFGATFIVIAPEHPLAKKLTKDEYKDKVQEYIDQTQKKNNLDRISQTKEKTGVFTGSYAINHVTDEAIPIWIADFVLPNFGTGAVQGCPGHDIRDFEFAKKFSLPIKRVVVGENGDTSEITTVEQVIEKEMPGKMVNSEFLNGMNFKEAMQKTRDYFEEKGWGKRVITYSLRDWLVSRQRYWGAPIPIVYDPEGNPHSIDEKDLPVLLPDDVEFLPTGESPLKYHEEFHKRVEEKYGKGWKPEVDTMDTFVDSSWYFFRFTDPYNEEEFASKEAMKKWLPVDIYVGGAEHTVLHLMYARFFTKVLYDEGYIDFNEPFSQLRHPGMVLGEDSRKMSKRWGNVVDPRTVADELGVDVLRVYEMFMGPFDQMKPWNIKTMQGVRRFIDRVYGIKNRVQRAENKDRRDALHASEGDIDNIAHTNSKSQIPNSKVETELNKLIKKVGEDITEFKFNTAIAEFMKFVNLIEEKGQISEDQWKRFLKVFAPFAPFITEELWQEVNGTEFSKETSIHSQPWPEYDENLIKEDRMTIGVQINGKVRTDIEVSQDESEESVKEKVLAKEEVKRWVEGKEVKKFVYVKGRIVNVVV